MGGCGCGVKINSSLKGINKSDEWWNSNLQSFGGWPSSIVLQSTTSTEQSDENWGELPCYVMNNWTVQLSTHRINTKWQWRAQWRIKCTWWQEGSKNLLPLLLLRQTEKAADCVAVVLVLSPFFVPSTHRHGGRILVCCCWGLICTQDTEMQKRTRRGRGHKEEGEMQWIERERHTVRHTHTRAGDPFHFTQRLSLDVPAAAHFPFT